MSPYAFHKLKVEGTHDISVRVAQIIDTRYKELQEKKANTSLVLEKKDIPAVNSEEVESLKAENKAMQEQLAKMQEMNVAKANLLYNYLDSQDYYFAPVKKDSRSLMNVTFVTGDADLDKKFASEAAKAGLKNLKGHRSVGGMRASIYNAMPYAGVEALIAFMKKFAAENPKA